LLTTSNKLDNNVMMHLICSHPLRLAFMGFYIETSIVTYRLRMSGYDGEAKPWESH